MKKYLLILFLIISTHDAFAFPCPNGGIIYKGDTIDQVEKQCGMPDSINTYNKIVNVVEKWIYYQTNFSNQANKKITFLVQNKLVVNIKINNENTTSLAFCNSTIKTRYTAQSIIQRCGKPVYKEPIEIDKIPVTVMKYNNMPSETFIFENGRLTDFNSNSRTVVPT